MAAIETTTLFRAKPEKHEDLSTRLTDISRQASQEIGCQTFEIHQSTTDKAVVIVIERWQSEDDLIANRRLPYRVSFEKDRPSLVQMNSAVQLSSTNGSSTNSVPKSSKMHSNTAVAAGAMAIGALAIGALAIGALAIGRLAVRKAHFGAIDIDSLTIRRLNLPRV